MQSQKSQLYLPTWVFLLAGYLIGQTTQAQYALLKFSAIVENGLVPLYTVLVVIYISRLIWQKHIIRQQKKRRVSKKEKAAQKRALESALVGVTEDQPCDLSGAYKLVSLENFDTFLEVQSKKRICVASLLQSYEFVILTSYLNTHHSNIFGIRKEFLGLFERQPAK